MREALRPKAHVLTLRCPPSPFFPGHRPSRPPALACEKATAGRASLPVRVAAGALPDTCLLADFRSGLSFRAPQVARPPTPTSNGGPGPVVSLTALSQPPPAACQSPAPDRNVLGQNAMMSAICFDLYRAGLADTDCNDVLPPGRSPKSWGGQGGTPSTASGEDPPAPQLPEAPGVPWLVAASLLLLPLSSRGHLPCVCPRISSLFTRTPAQVVLRARPPHLNEGSWNGPKAGLAEASQKGLLDNGGDARAPWEGDGKLWEGSGTAGRLAWLPSEGRHGG